jgi:uncharacterized protein (DUF2249 family)
MITAETNLGELLDEHPELVEVLAGRHDHFARLRNRVLRRLMAPRVTVGQAAGLAGVPVADLVTVLRRALGEPAEPLAASPAHAPTPVRPVLRPAELDRLHVVELDVRDDLRRGEEPFTRIMAAIKALGISEALVIRAPFEPIPLYDVLGRRGLVHWTEQRARDDWCVWFHRGGSAPVPPAEPTSASGAAETIDVRGLEPPLPMVRVLERIDTLVPGTSLTVLHERRPLFLYPQLDARGFQHETDEPEPGLVRIRIRKGEP